MMKKLKFLFAAGAAFFSSIDAKSQTWETLATTNECAARHENTMTAVGDQLVLLGGRGLRPTEVYNTKTSTWQTFEAPPLEMNHLQAVTYNGDVYVMGSFTGGYPHETPIPNIYIFDMETKEWKKDAEIPSDRLRGSAGVVVHNDKIYMICGIIDGHYDGHVTWFDEYDPATKTWKKMPDAPRARDHFSGTILNNKLYVAAGRRSSAKIGKVFELTEAAVDVFDFKTQTWSTLPADQNIPTERAGTMAVTFNKGVVIIGGETGQQLAHNQVESYNPKTKKWTSLAPLNMGRHGTGAAVVNKKIYIVAGSKNRGGGPEINTIEVLGAKK
jgi:N-acetylneuraminic acid mutarotase